MTAVSLSPLPDDWHLGAEPLAGGSTRFCVWAPRAATVEVRLLAELGSLVARTERLAPFADGYHAGVLPNVSAGARYFYRLSGGQIEGFLERPDPASRSQPLGVHGPSHVVPNSHVWRDAAWRGRPLAEYVLYELHVGTFTEGGTLDAVLAELDDLARLGINAIELMPLAQFSGARNWGYDGVYPYAVQHNYGGPAALARLVDSCHQRSIAVVLDVVYNHLGPEGNYLADFGPYFSPRHGTPWGPALNFDGPQSDSVRRFFIENAVRWVRDFHVDGLRLDAIHAIVDQSANPFLAELADEVKAAANAAGRPVWLIAENNRNDPRIFSPPAEGGLNLDAQVLDDYGRSLEALLTGQQQSYYADFGRLDHFARAMREGFVLTGQYSHYRGRRHGRPSTAIPPERFCVYAQTHDQVGNRPRGERLQSRLDFAQCKLAAAATVLSPYVPLIFMGEEYGETAPFLYFIDHGDAELVERVRAGRRREFTATGWQTEPVDPQSPEAFTSSKLNRTLRNSGQHAVLWAFYAELLRLRRELWPLGSSARKASDVTTFATPDGALDSGLLAYRRESGPQHVAVVLNFSGEPAVLSAEQLGRAEPWDVLMLSSDERWSPQQAPAAASSPQKQVTATRWELPGWTAAVFRQSAAECR